MAPQKKAHASLENLRRIFTVPDYEASTLGRIEQQISKNLAGFLNEHIVSAETEPRDLELDFLDSAIPDEPVFVSEQADFLLSKVVAQSVHTASPAFIGHMTSALPSFMLPLTKIMIALNQNLVKIETSKAFTPLERQVLGMLHRLVYNFAEQFYETHSQSKETSLGTFCSGGTTANMTALWVARNKLLAPKEGFSGVNDEGLAAGLRAYGYDNIALIVSKRGHYSFKKAADLIGIGKKFLITVETDANNKMNIEALRREIAQLREARVRPLALIGIAGTTETGNVDPLNAMAGIAEKEGIFFHVDAAWGGPTLFSERYRHLLAGIERADSVTIDAHKQLYVPMGAGMVLFRDENDLQAIENEAHYIIRRGSRDLGRRSLEGSRPGMALLVHSGLRIIGRKGYELLIDLGIGKAKQFAKMIQAASDFELVSEPELNLLTYRYVPPTLLARWNGFSENERHDLNDIINELTIAIQKEERARGKTFVSRTQLEPEAHGGQSIVVFRAVLANPLTTRQILTDILSEQREIAEILIAEEFHDRFKSIVGAFPKSPSPANPQSAELDSK